MGKITLRFVCQGCGAAYSKWAGRCENCGDWNCDGRVNPVDMVLFVRFVYLGIAMGPCDPCAI